MEIKISIMWSLSGCLPVPPTPQLFQDSFSEPAKRAGLLCLLGFLLSEYSAKSL